MRVFIISITLLCLASSCSEPCVIPFEPQPVTKPLLREGSLVTYESTLGDSNMKIFQRPPWKERVLTLGATIGGRDSVLALESEVDLALRFLDVEIQSFYQYFSSGIETSMPIEGFWLRLPLDRDTAIQSVSDTSISGHPITVTYKSYFIDSEVQSIDGKSYGVRRVQTDYSWDDTEDNKPVHYTRQMWTLVQPELGLVTEQAMLYDNGRVRFHTIVDKIEY